MIWRGNWKSRAKPFLTSCRWWALPRRRRIPALSKSTRRSWSANIWGLTRKRLPRPRNRPAPRTVKKNSKPRLICRISRDLGMCCARSHSRRKLLSILRHGLWRNPRLRRLHRQQPPRKLKPRRLRRNPQLRNRQLRRLLRGWLRRHLWRPSGLPQ